MVDADVYSIHMGNRSGITIVYQAHDSRDEMNVKTRKTRIDKGILRIPDYQYDVLRWIGEMGGVRKDVLTRLLGNKLRNAGRIAVRWVEMGLAYYQKIEDGQMGSWIWLTRKGLEEVGLPFKEQKPKQHELHHHRMIALIRLKLESRWPDITDVKGPGRLDWEYNQLPNEIRKITRNPDMSFRLDGQLLYVEYERSPKGKRLTEEWVNKLYLRCLDAADELSGVYIFYDDRTASEIGSIPERYNPVVAGQQYNYFIIRHINDFLNA